MNTDKFLKLVISEMNCSYYKIAEVTNSERQQVSRWKNGKEFIPLEKAEILCDWAGMNLADVLPGLMTERSRTNGLKKAWRNISRRVACFLVLPGVALLASHLPEINQLVQYTVYYVK